MTTCRYAGPGAGEAAGPGKSRAGEAEGCSFSRPYFLALRVTGSVFRPVFYGFSFAFEAGERSFLSSGAGISGRFLQFPVVARLEGWWRGWHCGPPSELGCLSILSPWTEERKLQYWRFSLILLSDSCWRTDSENYSLRLWQGRQRLIALRKSLLPILNINIA